MTNQKSVCTFLVSGLMVCSIFNSSSIAKQVSLPFSEPFNTLSTDAATDPAYSKFTAQQVNGIMEHWTVDANGLRTSTVNFFNFAEPAFSVTPFPKPTGEIVINVDMSWDGTSVSPPNQAGTGANGLRFGEDPANPGFSLNTMLFHPGYPSPTGAFRINGPGGFDNENMGWMPQLGVLNHVEIHSFPSGLFMIKVTDGTNPSNIFEDSFTSPGAYGGDIGLLAAGQGGAAYKNLTIALANPPVGVQGDYNGNGVVDMGDYVVWRNGGPLQNEVDNPGTIDLGDYNAWRARFGNTTGSGSGLGGSSAVPEPATPVMLSTVGAALLLTRRKSAK